MKIISRGRLGELIPVKGHFDRGRTRQNRGEAEAIIEELIRRCYDEKLSGQSVGIVSDVINIITNNHNTNGRRVRK